MSVNSCFFKLAIIFSLLTIVFVRDASLTVLRSADSYKTNSENSGLYNSSDSVIVLNVTNFGSSINGSDRAWLVEFYNRWCGHCQRFAPSWKALADNILGWRDIVTVAAIDCVAEDNNPICRDYEIMHYPELRYFAPRGNLQNLGLNVEAAKDMDDLRRNVLNLLEKEQQEGRGSTWPNLTPYRSSEIKDPWEKIPESVKYLFFVFETPDSHLGSEIILDFHNVTSLRIRRVTTNNSMLCTLYDITKFPSVMAFDRKNVEYRLNPRPPTRRATRSSIKEFMTSKGIDVIVRDVPDEYSGEWQKAKISETPKVSTKNVVEEKLNIVKSTTIDDAVHQADLESALRFSLEHEISMMKIIANDRMTALKNYLNAVASYFPIKRGNPMFLGELSFLMKSKKMINGSNFATTMKQMELEMAPVYSARNLWIGCHSEKSTLRRYPCGLWKLFHTLTVNFAIKSEEYTNVEPTQILKAIHGYVENFFGCHECARHFVDMARRRNMTEVRTADESVLWLWEAHNEVNDRLKSDPTTDPEHPKIQYPSDHDCPSCRLTDGSWNRDEVLNYMKKRYSHAEIINDDSIVRSTGKRSIVLSPARERLHLALTNDSSDKSRRYFTNFDISICVVLYVASAAILILVCIKFAVKRSSRKKHSVSSYDGKA